MISLTSYNHPPYKIHNLPNSYQVQTNQVDTKFLQEHQSFHKAFQEISKQDIQELQTASNGFQFCMLGNFLGALDYLTIPMAHKDLFKDLSTFSSEDFIGAKTSKVRDSQDTFENYFLDSYGFLRNDFLKEAGLLENLKFHSNSLQAIKNYLTLPFYQHNSEDGKAYFSNYFNSVDIGGGLKNAFEELKNFIPIKDNYTKKELLEAFENDKDFMDIKLRSDIPLIADYTIMENGSEKIALEGVIMLFSLSNYGESYAKSGKSQLGEYGKYLAGIPNSWLKSPSILEDATFQETSKIVGRNMTDWFLQEMLGLEKTAESGEQSLLNQRNKTLKYLGMESDL